MTSVQVVNLAGIEPEALDKALRLDCAAAVFKDDYFHCTNRAVKRRDVWDLCAPHGRKDELEVVVDMAVKV